MENKKKVFRSRISGFLIVFILVVLCIGIYQPKSYQELYTLGGVFLLIVLLFGGMRYIISGEKLYLKMWIIPNGNKNISDIISVERSYNLLSSPSASLKRLRIHFATGSFDWLISPVREKEFIEALKAINPDIDIRIPEETGKWRLWDWDIYK